MVAPLLASQTGRAMAAPAAAARPSGVDGAAFAALLTAREGGAADSTATNALSKATASGGPPVLEALLEDLEDIARNGLAQLVAAGTDTAAQADAVSSMDTALRGAISEFDTAQDADLTALLTPPGAALPSGATATSATFAVAPVAAAAQDAVQAIAPDAALVGVTATLTRISDLLDMAAQAQGHGPSRASPRAALVAQPVMRGLSAAPGEPSTAAPTSAPASVISPATQTAHPPRPAALQNGGPAAPAMQAGSAVEEAGQIASAAGTGSSPAEAGQAPLMAQANSIPQDGKQAALAVRAGSTPQVGGQGPLMAQAGSTTQDGGQAVSAMQTGSPVPGSAVAKPAIPGASVATATRADASPILPNAPALPTAAQAGAAHMGLLTAPSPPGAGEVAAAPPVTAAPQAPSAAAVDVALPQAAPVAPAGEAETRTPLSFAALLSEAARQGDLGADAASPELPVHEVPASEPGAAPPRATEAAAQPRIAPASPPPPPMPSGFSRALTAQIRETSVVEGRTRIALTPGGLGEIEIELSRDAGQLKVVIRAENQTVLQALRGDRDGLMAMLGNSGSDVAEGQLSFESFDRGQRDGSAQDRRGTGRTGAGTATAADTDIAPATDAPASPTGNGQLDILT